MEGEPRGRAVNAEAPNESPAPAATSTAGKQTVDPWNVQGEVGEDGVVKRRMYVLKVTWNAVLVSTAVYMWISVF